MKKIAIFSAIIILLLIVPSFASCQIGILKSPSSIEAFGWLGEWEIVIAKNTLTEMGFKCIILEDKDLINKNFKGCDLIILPGNRCMPVPAAKAVREYWQAGGKVLAFYLASYRDEKNKMVGSSNNFQLSDMFGCDFFRWTSASNNCESIYIMNDGIFQKTGTNNIILGRNTAMLVKPHEKSVVLGKWLNSKREFQSGNPEDAAIIMNNGCIYVGENLLALGNSDSLEVRRLVAGLIEQLIPNCVNWEKVNIEPDLNFSCPVAPSLNIRNDPYKIRVFLKKTDEGSVFSSNGPFKIFNLENEELLSFEKNEIIKIHPINTFLKEPMLAVYSKNGQFIKKLGGEIKIVPFNRSDYISHISLNTNNTYDLNLYRGQIDIILKNKNMIIINELGLEAYTAGVIANEMPPWYGEEALKVMAVISRTFALANKNYHKKEETDVCSTVHCQVYKGMLSERKNSNSSVEKSEGKIITYNGKYAYTTFHACCGGVGARIQDIWEGSKPVPYLKGAPDLKENLNFPNLSDEEKFKEFLAKTENFFCSESSRFRWDETYSDEEISRLFNEGIPVTLKDKTIKPGKILDIIIMERSNQGRVMVLKIIGENGTYFIKKDKIRWIFSKGEIGVGGLQSTLFYITKSQKDNHTYYTFHGAGWGHGVGMCQEGVGKMVKLGFKYIDIIKHYYPGTEVINY